MVDVSQSDLAVGYGSCAEPVGDSIVGGNSTHDERLRAVLTSSDARMANMRLGHDSGPDALVEAARLAVQGIMDEHGIGPSSPYVTHHVVAEVANRAVMEALQAARVVPLNGAVQ